MRAGLLSILHNFANRITYKQGGRIIAAVLLCFAMFSLPLAIIARILIALVVGRYGLVYQNGLYGLYLRPLCLRIAWNMRTLSVNLRDPMHLWHPVIDGEHGPAEQLRASWRSWPLQPTSWCQLIR